MLHLANLLLPVLMHHLPLSILIILLLRQQIRRRHFRVAHFRADDIRTRLRLVLHRRRHIIRVLQVQRRFRQCQLTVVLRAELSHLCRSPDRTVRLRHYIRHCFRRSFSRLCLRSFSGAVFQSGGRSFYRLSLRSARLASCFLLSRLLLRLFLRLLLRNQLLQRLRLRLILRRNTHRHSRQQQNQK